PPIAAAGASTPPAFTVCRPTHGAANPRRQGGKVERAPSPGPVGCLASGERRGHCSARVWTCGAAWKYQRDTSRSCYVLYWGGLIWHRGARPRRRGQGSKKGSMGERVHAASSIAGSRIGRGRAVPGCRHGGKRAGPQEQQLLIQQRGLSVLLSLLR